MKTSLTLIGASVMAAMTAQANDLVISGVIDGPLSGGVPKAVELYVVNDIADLSTYGIGSANNGGGTDGIEFTFPSQAATAGSYIYVASEEEGFTAFFGQAPNFTSGAMGINGDDAIELFQNDAVIDTFGDINVDGNGTAWEYLDGWAYRNEGETTNGGTFDASNWSFSGVDALDGASNNASAATPFPIGTFAGGDAGGEEPPEEPIVNLGVCGDDATFISVIQGSDTESSEVGNSHIIEGVITATRDGGFFVQEDTSDEDGDAATSEGIFVSGSTEIAFGHEIRLYGEIAENFGMTTLNMDADVAPVDCGTGGAVTVTSVALPLDVDLETLEGMHVSVVDAVVTSSADLWRYGDLVVSDAIKRQPSDQFAPLTEQYNAAVVESEANLILIEDNSGSRYPDELSFFPTFSYANPIRIGDTVSAQGPLNYSFGNYRINPIETVTVTSTREATPVLSSGNLSIATFNVLNYFNGQHLDDGSITFDYEDNRGAESEEEFDLQQARIVEAIVTMDADVVGLMELENDGFGENSAVQALVNAVNADLAEEQQYAFISTSDASAIGTDAITVGLIYRPTVVSPLNDAVVVEMPVQEQSDGDTQGMRPTLLQSFTHTETEQTFAVAVNHFKSKGSGCAEDESSEITQVDEIQGSCNALRVSASVALGEALSDETLPERLVVLGDLNAYSAEDPVAVLTSYTPEERGYTIKTAVNTNLDDGASVEVTEGYGFHNLAEELDAEGYSYWFFRNGFVGSLDHVLVSDSLLAEVVDGTHWNINSVEAYQLQYDQALAFYPDVDGYAFTDVGPFRSSDHDPFIATFSLVADEEPAPAPEPTPEPEPVPEPNVVSGGGSMGFILGLMTIVCVFRRRIS